MWARFLPQIWLLNSSLEILGQVLGFLASKLYQIQPQTFWTQSVLASFLLAPKIKIGLCWLCRAGQPRCHPGGELGPDGQGPDLGGRQRGMEDGGGLPRGGDHVPLCGGKVWFLPAVMQADHMGDSVVLWFHYFLGGLLFSHPWTVVLLCKEKLFLRQGALMSFLCLFHTIVQQKHSLSLYARHFPRMMARNYDLNQCHMGSLPCKRAYFFIEPQLKLTKSLWAGLPVPFTWLEARTLQATMSRPRTGVHSLKLTIPWHQHHFAQCLFCYRYDKLADTWIKLQDAPFKLGFQVQLFI